VGAEDGEGGETGGDLKRVELEGWRAGGPVEGLEDDAGIELHNPYVPSDTHTP
jgi:hypothetical protein